MSENKYNSRITEPTQYATNKGGTYVTAFDVVRSDAGRVLITRHAMMAKSLGIAGTLKHENANVKGDQKKL